MLFGRYRLKRTLSKNAPPTTHRSVDFVSIYSQQLSPLLGVVMTVSGCFPRLERGGSASRSLAGFWRKREAVSDLIKSQSFSDHSPLHPACLKVRSGAPASRLFFL